VPRTNSPSCPGTDVQGKPGISAVPKRDRVSQGWPPFPGRTKHHSHLGSIRMREATSRRGFGFQFLCHRLSRPESALDFLGLRVPPASAGVYLYW